MRPYILVLLCSYISLVQGIHEKYDGYQTYKVVVKSQEHSEAFKKIVTSNNLDVLVKGSPEQNAIVLVPPEKVGSFLSNLEISGILYSLHKSNVKDALEKDDKKFAIPHISTSPKITYDKYYRYADIDAYLQYLAEKYPTRVKLIWAGKSFEGRIIRYVIVSSSPTYNSSRPMIYLDSGIHAREWITLPVATFVLHKLLEDVDAKDAELTDKVDWIVHPLVNPDGYEYTWTNDRFWRRSRSTDGSEERNTCPGVDLNRNFEFSWNASLENGGASVNPCDYNYDGPLPFSETETQVVRNIILRYADRILLYMNFHSYASDFIYAWNNNLQQCENADDLQAVGEAMADAIASVSDPKIFPKYITGNAINVSGYYAAGTADDYAHYAGVPLTYEVELPGILTNESSPFEEGFVMDPKYISQIVKSMWEGIKSGVRLAINGTDWRSRAAKDRGIFDCNFNVPVKLLPGNVFNCTIKGPKKMEQH